MSASSANSPQQFKLFMTGTEWKNSVTHSTDGPIKTSWGGSLWEEKEARSRQPAGTGHGSGVYDSMKAEGYRHNRDVPPALILEDAPNGKSVRTVQSEGHHRIAAAAALEAEGEGPYYIPTKYTDNTSATRNRIMHNLRTQS